MTHAGRKYQAGYNHRFGRPLRRYEVLGGKAVVIVYTSPGVDGARTEAWIAARVADQEKWLRAHPPRGAGA